MNAQKPNENAMVEASRHLLAMAVEQAAETIMITDPTGAILYVNPVFEKITGYTCEEAFGKNPRILKSGKHDAEFYRQMWATLTAGRVWSGHFINKRKDGTFYEEDANISPVHDAAGTIINYVTVKRDVTHEMELEEQYRQAVKMDAVGRLAGGVAHDFNNRLQIIMGCTEMILHNLPPDHPIQDDLHEIQNAARHSADLTRQLLAFSRKQAVEPVVIDVNAVIAGSLKMLRRLVGENIRLNFTVLKEVVCVLMDPSQMDQILANLAINARDAIAGTGSISITVGYHTLLKADCRNKLDFAKSGDYVVITFTDSGAGMTPEIQSHIFEPFFTTKGAGKGVGLGLATVYGIVKQNNGTITVHSAPEHGTTFTIYLPRANNELLVAGREIAEQMPAGSETVLVVEDDDIVLNLVQRTLTKQGYKVLMAVTSHLALQICEQYPDPIHLLLTDVIMPDMGGKELVECIQKLRPGISVLYMSGYTVDIREHQGHLSNSLRVLQKPFTAVTLAQHVRNALENMEFPGL